MKNRTRGAFTMIELIFVIIILGILAVTALPKFVGIQDDARIAAEQGVVGAVRGGITLAHSKWLIRRSDRLDWDGDEEDEHYSDTGYLLNLESGVEADDDNGRQAFAEILNEPADEWTKTYVDDNTSDYTGPASTDDIGVADTGTNELNTSGEWRYSSTGGTFRYQKRE